MAFLYGRDRRLRGLKAERGFTLLEIFIALAILAIGVGVALPMFRNVIRSTSVSNQTNDLITSLSTARAEAVRRGMQVAVVAVSGGSNWSTGWQVIADTNRDGVFLGADEVVSTSPALDAQYGVFVSSTGGGTDSQVIFAINGALTNTGFDMNVCYPTGEATKSRRIRVRASGGASSHKDTTGSVAAACPAGT